MNATEVALHLYSWGFVVRIIKEDGRVRQFVYEKSNPRNIETARELLQEVISYLEALKDSLSADVIF